VKHEDENEIIRRYEAEMDATAAMHPSGGAPPKTEADEAPGEVELPDPDTEQAKADGIAEGDPVDPPARRYPTSLAEVMKAKDEARRPVIAPWLRGDQRRATAAWAFHHYRKTAAFHAVRVPYYSVTLAAYAPLGASRLLTRTTRWCMDAEGAPVRAAAVEAADAKEYLKLSRQRDDRVRLRGLICVLASLFGVGVAIVLMVVASGWLQLLAAVVAVATLGWVGAPDDKPVISAAKVGFRHRKLTADVVTRAFTAAGLTTKDQDIAFPRPILPEGDGWRVTVDLPYGKSFADAMKNHERIASGLDAARTQVFLDRDPSSERRLSMWVAQRDPLAIPAGPTPLLSTTTVDFWKPFPWGVDERGNVVMATMLWLSLLVGAVPRQGKTFSARIIALAAALDPYVRLVVFDGKASPDWRRFTKVAHRVGFGIVPRNGVDPVERFVAALLELKADVEDRYHRLSELPLHVCPEGKLTPEISRSKRYNMPLTLVVVDEVQEYLTHPEHGKLILELLVYLVRVAPAVGVSVMTATQKPDDKACPSELRDQHQARFALRVSAYQVSEAVLGAGSYGEGLDASKLLKSHKGVGLLKGMSDDAGIVRTYLADGTDADSILTRAQKLREEAGTLTGDAAGQALAGEAAPSTLLEDIAAVVPPKEAKQWSETVVERIALEWPDKYGPWAQGKDGGERATTLAAALKPYGVGTVQVHRKTGDGSNPNRKGIKRADILTAITQRNKKRDTS
jgi:S-DNA-T family DNA segregation ATPase FtsK/SpoIIIE